MFASLKVELAKLDFPFPAKVTPANAFAKAVFYERMQPTNDGN
jgi:hypothetical protein